jgi:biopolymer transport protein ExbD
MKFPRNARIFRGQLDAAPFAAVLFLLVMFMALSSRVYTPGVRLQLPTAENLPGPQGPTAAVAMDAAGRLYFENQVIEPQKLRDELRLAVKASADPLTLIVQADQAVTYDMLVRLTTLAREAGITNSTLATLPRPLAAWK